MNRSIRQSIFLKADGHVIRKLSDPTERRCPDFFIIDVVVAEASKVYPFQDEIRR